VGVVFFVGHYYGGNGITDDSDYSSTIGTKTCHGYVMALTEASQSPVKWCSLVVNNLIRYDKITGEEGYQGYKYLGYIKDSKYNTTLQEDFPVFYACDSYGTADWHPTLATPINNTSGWYLPTITQLKDIRKNLTEPDKFTFKDKESLMKTLATVRCKLPEDCEYLKYMLPSRQTGWWSCSQRGEGTALFLDLSAGADQSTTGVQPTQEHHVRPALSY
ncbi:MAG: hypothetical protein K2K72_08310, partial [Duncaniella sp.]|nr:hypothetical protein [Duncaniella sp.]